MTLAGSLVRTEGTTVHAAKHTDIRSNLLLSANSQQQKGRARVAEAVSQNKAGRALSPSVLT